MNAKLAVHAVEVTVSILKEGSNVFAQMADLSVKTELAASILMSALYKGMFVVALEDVRTCLENSSASVTLDTLHQKMNKAATISMNAWSETVVASTIATTLLVE
jgi:hypothetical protein